MYLIVSTSSLSSHPPLREKRERRERERERRQYEMKILWCCIEFISGILLGSIIFWLVYTGVMFYLERDDPIVFGPEPIPVATTVAPGDTLWGIAKEFYPNEHTGEVVFEIRKLNPGLDPGNLRIGQRVILPYRDNGEVRTGGTREQYEASIK